MQGTRVRQASQCLALCLLLPGLGCARVLYNFGEVEPGRVYRAGQPSPLFLRWLTRREGIRTLVNLRGKTQGFESAFAARHGLRVHSFSLSRRRPPTDDEVERFLAILQDPANHPILVHCRNGADRTGYMIGIYRVTVDGWSAERAAREMRRYFQLGTLNPVPQEVVRERAADRPPHDPEGVSP
ncbi:MAG: tyrosine-protein phosphatase [Myxococcota bacterium]